MTKAYSVKSKGTPQGAIQSITFNPDQFDPSNTDGLSSALQGYQARIIVSRPREYPTESFATLARILGENVNDGIPTGVLTDGATRYAMTKHGHSTGFVLVDNKHDLDIALAPSTLALLETYGLPGYGKFQIQQDIPVSNTTETQLEGLLKTIAHQEILPRVIAWEDFARELDTLRNTDDLQETVNELVSAANRLKTHYHNDPEEKVRNAIRTYTKSTEAFAQTHANAQGYGNLQQTQQPSINETFRGVSVRKTTSRLDTFKKK